MLCKRILENADEANFDKMLYTYGLDLYGNVALIEPEEESETALALDTLVVAVDTSGSCEGMIMQLFISQLRQLLMDLCEKVIFKRIIIMQSDCRILKEEIYESPADMPQSLMNDRQMNMYGFGGTSFVPVFERADELKMSKGYEIEGLIYFSDGCGTFPAAKPSYETVFVLPADESDGFGDFYERFIPGWVKKSYIREPRY